MNNAAAFGPAGRNVFIEPGGHLFVNTGTVRLNMQGTATVNKHILVGKNDGGLASARLVYASTVGLLLPCLVFGLSAQGLLWRPSDRSAPLLGEASWAVKIGCWLVMQVATLPISLAWALAAAALPWLFLKGGHGS